LKGFLGLEVGRLVTHKRFDSDVVERDESAANGDNFLHGNLRSQEGWWTSMPVA
jgi:hypothetical protein